MKAPAFPNVKVKCKGEDGNLFSILERVVRALRKAKVGEAEIFEYERRATNGKFTGWVNYNDFLRVTYETVTVI